MKWILYGRKVNNKWLVLDESLSRIGLMLAAHRYLKSGWQIKAHKERPE